MITSVKTSTKSTGLIAWPPNRKANANDIPVIPISTHPNFRGSNKKNKRNSSCIRCHYEPEKGMLQVTMYRRQLLMAFTSLPWKPQQMIAAMPPPPNFTDYHKLSNAVQEAQIFKNSPHGRSEINDVVRRPSSTEPLKHPNRKRADELSAIIDVPRAQEVVKARVRRSAAMNLVKEKEEELVLEGIEVRNDKALCFDVYIKLGQEEQEDEEELYVGTLSHMPPCRKLRGRHSNKSDSDGRDEDQKRVRCCLRLGLNDMLIDQAETVIVRLVPTFNLDDDPIKVASIFIDYT